MQRRPVCRWQKLLTLATRQVAELLGAGGGQVSHLAKIKFNRVPGCEEVCEWEVKWEMGDLTLTPKLV